MERKELEVFSEASNYAIVRLPGRRFPGCVIQGDSLSMLLGDAQELLEHAREVGDNTLVDLASGLVEALSTRLSHYESVLKEHGIELPYVK